MSILLISISYNLKNYLESYNKKQNVWYIILFSFIPCYVMGRHVNIRAHFLLKYFDYRKTKIDTL